MAGMPSSTDPTAPAAAAHPIQEDGWRDEIFRWYDTGHMPGLAAVPGCIHARRLLNHDHGLHGGLNHGALSLACYDLVSPGTLGPPPARNGQGLQDRPVGHPLVMHGAFVHVVQTHEGAAGFKPDFKRGKG